MLPLNQVLLGDAIEIMRSLPDGCVDALISDLPYGTTKIKWDKSVNLNAFWAQANRVCKNVAAVVLFSVQPFTTDLIVSNRQAFRCEVIWHKTMPLGFFDANYRPLKAHENILVFCRVYRNSVTYNPQKTMGTPYSRTRKLAEVASQYDANTPRKSTVNTGERYPTSVIKFSNSNHGSLHPTQKPLDLMRWLVRTYTNPGDLILDPYAGSASTCHAALIEERNFIGVERDPGYHAIAVERIAGARTAAG